MYQYKELKHTILTDEGQRRFLAVRDHTRELLQKSGAVTMGRAISAVTGDTWEAMACVDRMVELGEIREIKQADCMGQNRMFVLQMR